MKIVKYFECDTQESVLKYGLFQLAILIPLILGVVFFLITAVGVSPSYEVCIKAPDCIPTFFHLYQDSFKVMFLAFPLGTLAALNYRSIQTSEQVSLAQKSLDSSSKQFSLSQEQHATQIKKDRLGEYEKMFSDIMKSLEIVSNKELPISFYKD